MNSRYGYWGRDEEVDLHLLELLVVIGVISLVEYEFQREETV